MAQTAPIATDKFILGTEVFSWTAYDYHTHDRGWKWIGLLGALFGLIILGNLLVGDWIVSGTFTVVAALYIYHHKQPPVAHTVRAWPEGFQVRDLTVPTTTITGYWFVYDKASSLLKIETTMRYHRCITLQMGEVTPEKFRLLFEHLGIPELTTRQESVTDTWIRALKL